MLAVHGIVLVFLLLIGVEAVRPGGLIDTVSELKGDLAEIDGIFHTV